MFGVCQKPDCVVLVLAILSLELTQPSFLKAVLKNLQIKSYGPSTAFYRLQWEVWVQKECYVNALVSGYPLQNEAVFEVKGAIFCKADVSEGETRQAFGHSSLS